MNICYIIRAFLHGLKFDVFGNLTRQILDFTIFFGVKFHTMDNILVHGVKFDALAGFPFSKFDAPKYGIYVKNGNLTFPNMVFMYPYIAFVWYL